MEAIKQIRVLYIVGVGRSGSTILDTLLGNHPDIESVGEFINISRSGWEGNEFCSCRNRASDCGFWEEVKSLWMSQGEVSDVREYRELQNKYEFRLYKPSQVEKAALANPDEFKRFLLLTELLFQCVGQVSGKSVLVDSSKSRSRAYILSKLKSLDVSYVHLIRDARDIIQSLRKPHDAAPEKGVQTNLASMPGWRTSMSWVLANLQVHHFVYKFAGDRTCRVRYEDLLVNPEQALQLIQSVCGVDLTSVIAAALNETPLDVGHTIAGNRLRMKKVVAFKRKMIHAPKRISRIDTLSYSVLAHWLGAFYGYALVRRQK